MTNVARLKKYRANLIVFPRGSKHQPKAGDSSVEEQAAATQVIKSPHEVTDLSYGLHFSLGHSLGDFRVRQLPLPSRTALQYSILR